MEKSIRSPTSIFFLRRRFRSLRLDNFSSTLSEGITPESSLSISGTTLFQGSSGNFLGFDARCFHSSPGLEDDIKGSSEDPLEDGRDNNYGEDGNKGRPAHCKVGNKRVGMKWVEWDRPKTRHPFEQSIYTHLIWPTNENSYTLSI